ncbi:MAG TPA: sigma-70 family RNA polymerase sigma factor [bacterium]|nr:sigma-70 family RNA polymerase sigma factor [bacterium]HPN41993.1 sigma-70 family RNA polymerase sigma factor [bacterium]
MNESTQQELVDNLKSGDTASFAYLYQEFSGKVFTLAYRMLGNKEEAQDITQETFIRVFNNIHQFKGESKLYTWIYTITRNLCYHILQSRKKVHLPPWKR